MEAGTKRSTIYFEPALHQALRMKSAETSRSVSELVNNAVRETLAEDAEDLAAFEERANEPLIGYEDILKRLKKDGRI
ncbi:CopG family transcriptional regulator [Patescibacteria group bacterium]|nr:CopG family transcriptional regulator [Patescibacteria group bacterium]MBU1932083.1 CopG family transcriptional regulator [Patescibacteria group bacterium]